MTAPWKDQPTPIVDLKFWTGTKTRNTISRNDAVALSRNLERRMRAAERLLEHTIDWSRVDPFTPLSVSIKAHLDAARKEDGK